MPFQEVVGPVTQLFTSSGLAGVLGWGLCSFPPSFLLACPGRPWAFWMRLGLDMLPGGGGVGGGPWGGVGARGAVKVVWSAGPWEVEGHGALLTADEGRGLHGLAVGVWAGGSFRICGGRRAVVEAMVEAVVEEAEVEAGAVLLYNRVARLLRLAERKFFLAED